MKSPLRAGFIGYGVAGRLLHAPLIKAAGAEIAGVVTSRAKDVTADFPTARVFDGADALCASDVDVVVVVSPDHLHVAHTRLALEAGKHVIVDKPIAPTSAEALDLAEDAAKRGLLLSVFHNRRWDNDFLTVQKLIREGSLGEIMHYGVRWDRYRPARSGGWRDQHMLGEHYGLGSHLIDQALVLFGTPDWLWADLYKQRDGDGPSDGFEIVMVKGRCRVTLGVNLIAADELRACRVLGTHGAFVKTGLDPQEAQLKQRADVEAPDFGVEPNEAWGVLSKGGALPTETVPSETGNWLAFYRGVIAAIASGAPPPVTALEAARVVAVLEAAEESSRTGHRIDLPRWLAARGCA